MPFYHRLGSIPRKRHIQHPKPDGGIYQEHLMGNYGFTGPASLLYHIHPPTAVLRTEHLRNWVYEEEDHPMLRMRHVMTAQLHAAGSPVMDRVPIFFNNDCAICYSKPNVNDDYWYRNGSQDVFAQRVNADGTQRDPQCGR